MTYANLRTYVRQSIPDGVYAEAPEQELRRGAGAPGSPASTLPPGASSVCSATTAPARRPPSASSPRSRCRRRAARSSPASIVGRHRPATCAPASGSTGQSATVDGLLTARANLELVGRLYHMPRALRPQARGRAARAAAASTEAGDRLVRTFSGGMRRRLDLAASLVASPPVLFLDEPTTGLDPQSRNDLWELLSGLVAEGMTLVLTTQYLEEADRFADQIVRARPRPGHRRRHAGRAQGARRRRASRRHGRRAATELGAAAATLAAFGEDGPPIGCRDAARSRSPVRPGTRLIEVVRALDAAGVDAVDVQRREVTLDDVFLSLTRGTPAPAARCRMSALAPAHTTRASHARDLVSDSLALARAQPPARPPDPREAARRHDPAGHVRAAVRVRLRQRHPRPGGNYREYLIGGVLVQTLASG